MGLIPADDSLGIAVIAISAVFAALAIFAVILRLWSRRIQRIVLQCDDYACLLALACNFSIMVIGSLANHIQFFTLSLIASTVNSR